MVKQTIQIFARIKPSKGKAALYNIDEDDEGCPRLTYSVPRELSEGFINNKKQAYKFRFQKVFDQSSKQDEVFDHVARPVIDNVLEGYNGTIFAYGQTGSGKTFTITGGAERYIDRGIIPRTLSYIFEYFEKNSEKSFTAHISYLEIYNEFGYDLLDPKHEAAKLEDLPKVSLMEDSDQNIHLKNLSVHQASNEEDALNLLFLGDTNRMIAETPMNQASTRSHCIFSIHMTSREQGSATIRRSKLHLVDLAGSERVSKSGVGGVLLTEAKYINLSLHFLEQVIIALADKTRQHIPYRNSMMTSVLRDSLGGNCMTTMIATCAIERKNLDESISTCRFAQRVALIKNEVMLNEELDPKLMIQKLKREIQQLKEELAMATGEQRTDELSAEDLDRCEDAVKAYLVDSDADAVINVGADMRKIHHCFRIMKSKVLEKPSTPSTPKPATAPSPPQNFTPPDTGPYSNSENEKLKGLVVQRDNEINILVNMLKKEKKRAKDAAALLQRLGHKPPGSARGDRTNHPDYNKVTEKVNGHDPSPSVESRSSELSMGSRSSGSRMNTGSSDDWRRPPTGTGISQEKQKQRIEHDAKVKKKILGDMSIGRQEAFEIFRRDYEHNDAIEDNTRELKSRYAEAKSLGAVVNKSKNAINHLKGQIEHHRMSMAMQGLTDPNNPEPDETEIQLRHNMEEEKTKYKETFHRLRTLKTEIEHLQHLLEKAKVKLMKDFELWWAEQAALLQQEAPGGGNQGMVQTAWQTPSPAQLGGRTPSPANSEASARNQRLGRLRGGVAGNIAVNLKSSHSSNGGFNHAQQPVGLPPKSSQSGSGLRLTGDPQADADIMAFVKARQNILQQNTTMEQGDLADQLSLVQQMVMEMKQGFSTAMEELSKIQYGDQNLEQQLADNKKECAAEVKVVTDVVEELKAQVQTLSGQIERVTDAQRTLHEKIDSYQTDKEILLEELEKYGLINDQLRLRLSGVDVAENNNNNLPDVAPMVHPYLNSIQNHSNHRGPEDPYNDDASLTAAVHRSLSLTQALGEKCQNLDASTVSSEDDVNSRHSHSQSGSGHKPPVKRHGSFNYEDGGRSGQKIPPHEQVLDQVHRGEAARDIVDAEREYCTQIWSLVDNFMNPLREEEIVSLRECNTLFPAYIPLIYEQHCIMLRKLEERLRKWKFSGVIGDIFAKLTDSQDEDGLLLYKAYINDFPAIINCMNKWFAQSPQFCDVMQCPCLANSPVLPLLLAPLQQVPKYSLLLKNLLKFTPSDHPDRYYLESSLHKLKTFLNTMNDDLEHAMNVLNINSNGVTRSRETGASVRSRSSGSSGEVNHMSSTRDSGVHSGEERPKSPLSPNTTRRFVLQVLRERREKDGSHSPVKTDHHPSTPRGHNHSYGSHPDLTYNMPGYSDGRTSPYLASLPQSKTFTALSKLPLPHERGKKVRVNPKHEVHRPGINTNYLRPLTPQLFPTSTSAHSFDSMRRREELAERGRMRPASAIEMSAEGSERLERYHDLLRYEAALPTRQSVSTGSSDRSPSRKDMQLSLHKLLAETGHSVDDEVENEQERNRNEDTYHKQFLATKERILRKGSGKDSRESRDNLDRAHRRYSHGHIRGSSVDTGEDYGIYGEDDDVDNDNSRDEIDHKDVKPMKLLSQSHRPKIMVPKWRQNAPLQPSSYNTSVETMQKQNGYSSEENFAASLVQSLMDNPVSNNNENRNTLPRKNLKRKEASGRRSPGNVQSVPLSVHTPTRDIDNDSSQSHDVETNENEGVFSDAKDRKQKGERKERRGSGASTALIDVIAYTADCLDRSDSIKDIVEDNDNRNVNENIDSTEIQINGEIENSHSSEEEKQDSNLKPAAQDSSDHANSVTSVISSSKSVQENPVSQYLPVSNSVKTPISHGAVSWANLSKTPHQEPNAQPVNTDDLVYYFQHRKNSKSPTEEQVDADETNEKVANSNETEPIFYNKTVTSTPTPEGKAFAFNPDTFNAKTHVSKKDRLVRADETARVKPNIGVNETVNSMDGVVESMDGNKSDSSDKSDNKDKVLRAVDRLRMSFERPKTLAITNQNQTKGYYRPASADSSPQKQPLILKSFTLPQKNIPKENKTGDQSVQSAGKGDTPDSENAHRMYRKAGGLRTPTKHLGETTATARQIQKMERSASPTVKQNHPVLSNIADTHNDRAKSPLANLMQNAGGRLKRGVSPQRASKEGSLIPQRSGSPIRAISRPLSASSAEAAIDPLFIQSAQNGEPLKSAMKDTKIPMLRKSGSSTGTNQLSKSTEDISKMKKKSAFKDSLKNIFGRKKKKSKSSDTDTDLDRFFADMQLSFQQVDDMFTFPVTRQRSHSTSQILHSYRFEEDDDGDPVSAV